IPRSAVRLAISLASRDLPIPGSPTITTHPPCPAMAAFSAASSACSSASLPITTGHSTCAISPVWQQPRPRNRTRHDEPDMCAIVITPKERRRYHVSDNQTCSRICGRDVTGQNETRQTQDGGNGFEPQLCQD